MRATVWAGRNSVEVQSVPDPKILNDRDAIVKKIFQGYAIVNASPVATVSYGYAAQEPYPFDPKRAKAKAPQPIRSPTGIQTPRLPAFCSHFPMRSPMMLMPAAIQIPASTNVTAYHRVAPTASQRAPPIAAKLAGSGSGVRASASVLRAS